jgi:hypothetical protein
MTTRLSYRDFLFHIIGAYYWWDANAATTFVRPTSISGYPYTGDGILLINRMTT